MSGILIEQILNGLLVGSYYIVLSLGMSLIFSLGGVVNLAHGAFYALGAYFAYSIQEKLGFGGAVLLAPVGVALVGMLIEQLFLRRLYREDPMLGLLFTFGLAMTAEQSLRLIWGTTGLPFPSPAALRGRDRKRQPGGAPDQAQALFRGHRQTEREQQPQHRVLAIQATQEQLLDQHADQRHPYGGEQDRAAKAELLLDRVGEIRAQRVERAVGEIDHPAQAEYQRHPERKDNV